MLSRISVRDSEGFHNLVNRVGMVRYFFLCFCNSMYTFIGPRKSNLFNVVNAFLVVFYTIFKKIIYKSIEKSSES